MPQGGSPPAVDMPHPCSQSLAERRVSPVRPAAYGPRAGRAAPVRRSERIGPSRHPGGRSAPGESSTTAAWQTRSVAHNDSLPAGRSRPQLCSAAMAPGTARRIRAPSVAGRRYMGAVAAGAIGRWDRSPPLHRDRARPSLGRVGPRRRVAGSGGVVRSTGSRVRHARYEATTAGHTWTSGGVPS